MLGKSFILLRDGLAIPTPELLFFEMREEHDVLGLALLGMELCGGYASPGTVRELLWCQTGDDCRETPELHTTDTLSA